MKNKEISYKVRLHIRFLYDKRSVWSGDVLLKAKNKLHVLKLLPRYYYLHARRADMKKVGFKINPFALKSYEATITVRSTLDKSVKWKAPILVRAYNKFHAQRVIRLCYYMDAITDEMVRLKDRNIKLTAESTF